MEFFRKLERKYSKYAIHNLMNYIVAMYVGGVILQSVNPMFISDGCVWTRKRSFTDRSGGSSHL